MKNKPWGNLYRKGAQGKSSNLQDAVTDKTDSESEDSKGAAGVRASLRQRGGSVRLECKP